MSEFLKFAYEIISQIVYYIARLAGAAVKLFITVGILGGLTTFSTLNVEVFELIKSGKIFYGLFYMLISCLIGLLCTFGGYWTYIKGINS